MAAGSSTKTPEKRLCDDSFIGLPLFAFSYPGVATVDIYYKPDDQTGIKLVCDRRRGLAPNELSDLTERGVHYLFVRQTDYDRVTAALFENLNLIATDARYVAAQRLVLIQAAVCQPLEAAYRLLNPDQYVHLARDVGGYIGWLTMECNHHASQLMGVLQHGPTHAVHATNAAVYTCMLARYLGMDDASRVQEVAVGAMLHDLGLRRRRNSRGKLLGWSDSLEQATSHPQDGYELICERLDVSREQMLMVYQHHEHIDGSGGPVGLVGDEIHPWARMLAVTNKFDSLTSDRPGRSRLPHSSALAAIKAEAGTRMDAGYVQCWINAFQTQ